MATTNVKARRNAVHTHEGGKAVHNPTALAELRRSTLAALLFEDMFYETGNEHATRVATLVEQSKPEDVAALAVEAREKMHLRHMPLFLVRELVRKAETGNSRSTLGSLIRATLARVVQRPDEIQESLAMYWRGRKTGVHRKKNKRDDAVPMAMRRGLADAFLKFTAYDLGKYRGDSDVVKLRDALRIVHAKPKTAEQKALWKALREGTLRSADTWETELSAGKDKKATWERLIEEKKLGGLAFLRNLRNMAQAGVDVKLIKRVLKEHPFKRVLPFRFIAAAPFAPGLVKELGDAMERVLNAEAPTLKGKTVLLIDVSGSMDHALSGKSDLNRIDAAAGLAILARGRCEDVAVYTFSDNVVKVPSYTGLALKDAIHNSQPHSGTYLGRAVLHVAKEQYDRIIVVTDEQSADSVGAPLLFGKGYMINVAAYQHGVGFGPWVRISGFSERTLDFVAEYERVASE